MSPNAQYIINNVGIMHYYPFDTDMLDYKSGVGENNATVSNVYVSRDSTKLKNGAVRFPGDNTQSFKLPNVSFGKSGITIAVWIKCIDIPKNWMRICDFGNKYDNPSSALAIGFLPTNASNTSVPFVGIKTNSTGSDGNFSMGYNTSDTNWHHYAFVIQPTGTLAFYADGVDKTDGDFMSYPSLEPMLSSFIGKSNWVGDDNINCYMNQFVMFNRPLNSTEIGYLASNPSNVSFSSKESGNYDIGTSPTITNIAPKESSLVIHFSAGVTRGSHDVTTYYYSLDGGNTYRNAHTTASPITITGILPNTYYQVTLVASSAAGNTLPSNTVTGYIPTTSSCSKNSGIRQYVHTLATDIKESNKETFQSYRMYDSAFHSGSCSNVNNTTQNQQNTIYDYYTFRPKFT